jgi:hypothetical protein
MGDSFVVLANPSHHLARSHLELTDTDGVREVLIALNVVTNVVTLRSKRFVLNQRYGTAWPARAPVQRSLSTAT